MKLYDYQGNVIADISGTSNEMPVDFNFTALTDAFTANSSVTKTYNAISDDFGTLQYVGAICVNDKIYFAPNTANNILVYDTKTSLIYKIGADLGNQAFKYTGLVAWKGFVYVIPRGVNNMLKINPITDEVSIIDLGTTYPVSPYGDYRDSHHYNGVISDDGYMYLPPAYSSNKLLKIDMSDYSWQELDFASSTVSTWIGCVKHPTENKIIFLSTKVFRVWDCDTDTYTDVIDGTSRACYDMVYDPRYNSFIGVYESGGGGHIFALKLDDYTCIDSGWINYLSNGYGISLGVDGKYYHLEGQRAFNFIFDGSAFTQQTSITTSDNVGDATPYFAGQAIDNNGNIYAVPASGKMTKLTFSDVVKKLPDYIVSSQYYGKY